VTSIKLEQQCRRENGGAAEAEEQGYYLGGGERGDLGLLFASSVGSDLHARDRLDLVLIR
jgi:hypothetical protein